ncbi:MAG: DUF1292 domain-containing protein [Clostridia bacterium]|nr:DUF1292 domain-containing protein [Clostridia bacterium]
MPDEKKEKKIPEEEKQGEVDEASEDSERVTLVDEDGQEHEFELIGGCVDRGCQYYALIPAGDADSDVIEEYYIFKQIKNEDGTEDLVEIEDDAEFDRIAAKFDEAFDTEIDYDA